MRRGFLLGIAVMSLIGSVASLMWRSAPLSYDELPPEERYGYWLGRIETSGGPAAYEEFIAAVDTYPTPLKHINAHFFGKALYDAAGPPGIATCDGRFVYGCFHAFTIRAVEVGGLDAAREMFSRCETALGRTAEQCAHGIGHGVLGSLGYGTQDLEEALRICESLGRRTNPVGGCSGGAMMEYGNHGMQGPGLDTYRPFTEETRLEPCRSLAERQDRALCAYWQPMWWTESVPYRDELERLTEDMSIWCTEIAGSDDMVYRNCIAGIGNRMQILTGEDPTETARICALVSTDPLVRFLCHKASAVRFTMYYPLAFSLQACDGLPDVERERCLSEASAASAPRLLDRPE